MISLAGNPLPFWDEGVWEDAPRWKEAIGDLTEELDACDAFIIVTPEWHGMVPSGLKNLFLLLPGTQVLAHKPALIISVSGGAGGGAYPIAVDPAKPEESIGPIRTNISINVSPTAWRCFASTLRPS